MMKILIDTNFIITCLKQKIDFPIIANEIIDQKIEWIIPQDVLDELKTLKDKSGIKIIDKNAAELSFQILKNIKPEIIKFRDKNPNVDMKIVNYIINKDIVLATLDKNLKSRVKNKILTIRGKNNLELV